MAHKKIAMLLTFALLLVLLTTLGCVALQKRGTEGGATTGTTAGAASATISDTEFGAEVSEFDSLNSDLLAFEDVGMLDLESDAFQ